MGQWEIAANWSPPVVREPAPATLQVLFILRPVASATGDNPAVGSPGVPGRRAPSSARPLLRRRRMGQNRRMR